MHRRVADECPTAPSSLRSRRAALFCTRRVRGLQGSPTALRLLRPRRRAAARAASTSLSSGDPRTRDRRSSTPRPATYHVVSTAIRRRQSMAVPGVRIPTQRRPMRHTKVSLTTRAPARVRHRHHLHATTDNQEAAQLLRRIRGGAISSRRRNAPTPHLLRLRPSQAELPRARSEDLLRWSPGEVRGVTPALDSRPIDEGRDGGAGVARARTARRRATWYRPGGMRRGFPLQRRVGGRTSARCQTRSHQRSTLGGQAGWTRGQPCEPASSASARAVAARAHRAGGAGIPACSRLRARREMAVPPVLVGDAAAMRPRRRSRHRGVDGFDHARSVV